MNATATLLVTVAAALGLGAAPLADEPKGDLARLQGTWTAKVGPDKDIAITLTLKGNDADLVGTTPNGEEFKLKGELKLDEKKTPPTVDWIKFTGPGGNDLPENLGIYKIEGDTWTVCSGGPGNARPAKFEDNEGGSPSLTAWTRVKDKPKDKDKVADAAPEKPIKGDLARFQGAWSAKHEGVDSAIALEIKGNAVTARWPRGDGTAIDLKGEMRLNDQASPRTVDFFGFKDGSGDPMPDNLGLYAFDGETIKVCIGGPGNERPTEIKAGEGGLPTLLVFTRKKD